MKKELLLLSLMAGSLLAYSADQKNASPVREEVIVATEEMPRTEDMGEEDEDQVFVIVEKKAEFPGGQKNLMEYLRENIKYPEKALDKSLEGRVYVKFTIKKDGSIDEIKVIRSADPILDEEAIRVVKNMPKWIPAQHNGKDVNSTYTLPITFHIKS